MLLKRLKNGFKHSIILLQAVSFRSQWTILKQMVAFSRQLPARFKQPLPQMMVHLTPANNPSAALSANQIRNLADAVAAWHIRSPLGICLRRSLLRYHFLRQINLPVHVVFGARFKSQTEGGGIGGHAWLLLDGRPYYEDPQDYQGFTKMYIYPAIEDKAAT